MMCPIYRLSVWLILFTGISAAVAAPFDYPSFHGDPQRTGWIANETQLTPDAVASGSFGPLWNSSPLDSVTLGGTTYLPRLYASPLYIDSVTMTGAGFAGQTFHTVFAASSNGFVYAINAFALNAATPIAPGTVLWKTRLGTPLVTPRLDGGVPVGVLGTPVIDSRSNPQRIYVTSADATAGWQVFALDITNGQVLPGWPLNLNGSTLNSINQNGPTTFQPTVAMSQRAALALSPDGRFLYIGFGAYGDGGAGWLVAVDTTVPALASAFGGAPSSLAAPNAGIWESGGPAVAANGIVYVTTGNGTTGNTSTPGYWGQSVLAFAPDVPLRLAGTYTPWNYCQMEMSDADLAGGGPVIVPNLASTFTSTPNLLAFGGKQGNAYLLNTDQLPGGLVVRQGCSTLASTDKSLLPPDIEPRYGSRGPRIVFNPYTETPNDADFAKSRSVPAFYRAADGSAYLFHTGTNKAPIAGSVPPQPSTASVPPGLFRLKIVTNPGTPAYLTVDQKENTLTFLSPGSAVVTSNGSSNPVLWVPVANVTRLQSLLAANVPHPILYAIDPLNMRVLWSSTASMLNVGGKYTTVAVARGTVFVGTDRIQAFGLQAQGSTASPIRINAGGGTAGNFVADSQATGGHPDTYTDAINVSGLVDPAPQMVYQTKRTGDSSVGFRYTLSGLTANTVYKVRLHFVENVWTAPGQRIFNVSINGQTVLPNFDVFQAAGSRLKAVIREFTTTVTLSGQIVVAFDYGRIGNPLVNGLELLPVGSTPTPTPTVTPTPGATPTPTPVVTPTPTVTPTATPTPVAGAAPRILQSSSVSVGARTVSLTLPSAPQIGSVLVAIASAYDLTTSPTVTLSDNRGTSYTQRAQAVGSANHGKVTAWTAPVTVSAGPVTLTMTLTGNAPGGSLAVYEVSGAAAGVVDGTAVTLVTSLGTSHTVTPAITTTANDLIFGAGTGFRADTTLGAGSGWTLGQKQENNNTSQELVTVFRAGAPGNYSPQMTTSGNEQLIALGIAIKGS